MPVYDVVMKDHFHQDNSRGCGTANKLMRQWLLLKDTQSIMQTREISNYGGGNIWCDCSSASPVFNLSIRIIFTAPMGSYLGTERFSFITEKTTANVEWTDKMFIEDYWVTRHKPTVSVQKRAAELRRGRTRGTFTSWHVPVISNK